MHAAADEDEKANQDSCDTRAEPGVVVPCSTPSREAVLEEVVVALTERTAEDGADKCETAEALAGDFLGFTDLGLCQFLGGARGWLGLMFVGVETDGLLLVGLVDVVNGGREAGFNANEIWGESQWRFNEKPIVTQGGLTVEGSALAFEDLYFITEPEDFVV